MNQGLGGEMSEHIVCDCCKRLGRFRYLTFVDFLDGKPEYQKWCKKCIKQHNSQLMAFVTINRQVKR